MFLSLSLSLFSNIKYFYYSEIEEKLVIIRTAIKIRSNDKYWNIFFL